MVGHEWALPVSTNRTDCWVDLQRVTSILCGSYFSGRVRRPHYALIYIFEQIHASFSSGVIADLAKTLCFGRHVAATSEHRSSDCASGFETVHILTV